MLSKHGSPFSQLNLKVMGLYFQNYMVYIEFHNLQVLIENLPMHLPYTGPIYIHVHVQYYMTMCGCSNVSSMKKKMYTINGYLQSCIF